jgi:hypothetical protein
MYKSNNSSCNNTLKITDKVKILYLGNLFEFYDSHLKNSSVIIQPENLETYKVRETKYNKYKMHP